MSSPDTFPGYERHRSDGASGKAPFESDPGFINHDDIISDRRVRIEISKHGEHLLILQGLRAQVLQNDPAFPRASEIVLNASADCMDSR